MKIAVGSDHRGFEVKRRIVELLQGLGHEVRDLGPAGGGASGSGEVQVGDVLAGHGRVVTARQACERGLLHLRQRHRVGARREWDGA